MMPRRSIQLVSLLFALLCAAPALVVAQAISLTPAQQQMLNSLPPAQREQALDAIRRLNSEQQAQAPQSLNEPLTEADADVDPGMIDALLQPLEVRAEARSRVVINFTPFAQLDDDQQKRLSSDLTLQKLVGSHLFVLDDSGVLSLQGIERIPLLGLTEEDINRRLAAEPYLALFEIDTRILDQTPIGVEALQPFGYDLFAPGETGLDGPVGGPVPPDYVLGPGDTVRVQFFGNVNSVSEVEISRDGVVSLPELGPINAAGMLFSEFRSDMNKRVGEMLIGTQVSVTMGQLRTIRVFVLGDVNKPGSYVVSGLATMSGALYRSGGISDIGSLRQIQLKRNGKLVSTLDAYDLLIRGDTSGDSRLSPGDVIFVPPIGKTVAVGGAVNRPAIYEVKRLTTAADLVGLAGGLTSEAVPAGARLERIDGSGKRSVLPVNLQADSANDMRVQKGDVLIVPEVLPDVRDAIYLAGHVYKPGSYPWFEDMRLSDLVPTVDALQPGVDTEYVLIRRENSRGAPLEALSANLADALANPGSGSDVRLQSGDTVNFFSLSLGRQRIVEPLLEELKAQATIDDPAKHVQVSGSVRAPGVYPLEAGMRISDLIRAGGSLTENAYALEAELTRYEVLPSGTRSSAAQKIDLFAIRNGDAAADLVLQEHDYLIVSRVPEWDTIWTVTLEGEVKFPGQYRVRRGETLASVLNRAGGLTASAFPQGAVFLRESLKEQEQQQIEMLARRMEADLASLSLERTDVGGPDTLTTGRALLDQLRGTEAVGRLVIDLERIVVGRGTDIEVRDGDQLLVPPTTQVVTVLGETQQNRSHLYNAGMSRDDYISLSGGLSRRADKKLIYVVRADGSVVAGTGSRWFGRGKKTPIRPGDTIVVPLDTDRMRPLTFWGNVTQILYQGAIAVAAVRTFDN